MTGDEVFIVGCGRIGRRVAGLWLARGARVRALARSPESAARLRASGIDPVEGDLDRAESLTEVPTRGALVYYFAPPPRSGTVDERVRRFTEALVGRYPRRIVYISTTGVYGDRQGAWVTEDSAVQPGTDRARRRLDAENHLREFTRSKGIELVILRVAGIYGPEMLPVERLQRGDPVLAHAECGYTNRIHADDLAQVCAAAAVRGRPGAVYNVADGEPGTLTGYFREVAEALGLPAPVEVSRAEAERTLGEGILSYLGESRRIDNARMLEELGVRLQYPSLSVGLAASVLEELAG